MVGTWLSGRAMAIVALWRMECSLWSECTIHGWRGGIANAICLHLQMCVPRLECIGCAWSDGIDSWETIETQARRRPARQLSTHFRQMFRLISAACHVPLESLCAPWSQPAAKREPSGHPLCECGVVVLVMVTCIVIS